MKEKIPRSQPNRMIDKQEIKEEKKNIEVYRTVLRKLMIE